LMKKKKKKNDTGKKDANQQRLLKKALKKKRGIRSSEPGQPGPNLRTTQNQAGGAWTKPWQKTGLNRAQKLPTGGVASGSNQTPKYLHKQAFLLKGGATEGKRRRCLKRSPLKKQRQPWTWVGEETGGGKKDYVSRPNPKLDRFGGTERDTVWWKQRTAGQKKAGNTMRAEKGSACQRGWGEPKSQRLVWIGAAKQEESWVSEGGEAWWDTTVGTESRGGLLGKIELAN